MTERKGAPPKPISQLRQSFEQVEHDIHKLVSEQSFQHHGSRKRDEQAKLIHREALEHEICAVCGSEELVETCSLCQEMGRTILQGAMENTMVLSRLRKEWNNLYLLAVSVCKDREMCAICGSTDPSVTCSVCEDMSPGSEILLKDVMRVCICAAGKTVPDVKLAERVVAEFFDEVSLRRRCVMGETEWLHYGLLQVQAPSAHAVSRVNKELEAWLAKDATVQQRLLSDFLRSCTGYHEPTLTLRMATLIFNRWILRARTVDTPESDLLPVTQILNILLDEELIRGPNLTYYDYLSIMFGFERSHVYLYKYDMSKGHACWLSPALIGEKLQGIWHTSIVAFGAEYWYGGKIYHSSSPGETHWGEPTEICQLPGRTLRTVDELRDYLCHEAAHLFTVESYNMVTHNCNHFSDFVCRFLLNSRVPKDILQQAELVMGPQAKPALQMLRPMLGAQINQMWRPALDLLRPVKAGDGFATVEPHDVVGVPEGVTATLIARKKKEREKLIPDSFVKWEFSEGWHRTALLLSVKSCGMSCDLRWLDAVSCVFKTAYSVPLSLVRPAPDKIIESWISNLARATADEVFLDEEVGAAGRSTVERSSTEVCIDGLSDELSGTVTSIDGPYDIPCRMQRAPQPKQRCR